MSVGPSSKKCGVSDDGESGLRLRLRLAGEYQPKSLWNFGLAP